LWPREISAVPFRKKIRDAATFGQDYLDAMNVTVVGEKAVAAREDAVYGSAVNVVEKTVDEDEIERVAGGELIFGNVGNDKVAAEVAASHLDVTRIDVDALVRGMGEAGGVGARTAAYIENAAYLGKVIVFEDACELLRGERDLGEVEEEWLLEEVVEEFHGRRGLQYKEMLK